MRDRFDQRQERNLEAQLTGDDVVVRPPLTIVTGLGRRREWPADEKTRIIVESLKPGANVSEVARRNGLSPQHLFGWRREARELFANDRRETRATPAAGDGPLSPSMTRGVATSGTRCAAPAFVPPTFVPVVVTPAPPEPTPPPNGVGAGAIETGAPQTGTIEIVIGASVVRVTGRVDADALQTVVEIVRRLTCS